MKTLELSNPEPVLVDPDGVFLPEHGDGPGEKGPDRELRVFMPKSMGEPGDPEGENAEGSRGGICIFSCDPNRTILLSGFETFLSPLSSMRASTIPSPIPLESIFSQRSRLSGQGLGDLVFLSYQEELPMAENGLLSRVEVGLIKDSESVKPFTDRAVKSRGELNKEEVSLLCFSIGDERGA